MKTLLLATVAIGALACAASAADYRPIAAPAAVTQGLTGDLSLYAGFFHFHVDDEKFEDFSDSGSLIGGLARANLWLAPGMSLQFDLFGEGINGDTFSTSVVDVAGHMSWRNPAYLMGLFGSVGSAGGNQVGTIGAEAQSYIGQILLYAQGGYATAFTGNDLNAWYIHGEARYFIHPNLVASANLGYAKINYTGGNSSSLDSTAIRWGAELETRFSQIFGGFASYRGAHVSGPTFDSCCNWSGTSHAFLLGIKFYHNTANLMVQAQQAETLRNFSPLTGVNNLGTLNFGRELIGPP